MGANWNGVTEEDLALIRKALADGLSAREIAAKMPGRTRNGILGIIDRHIKGNSRRQERKTVRVLPSRPVQTVSHDFAEPSPPRRFTFQDLPS